MHEDGGSGSALYERRPGAIHGFGNPSLEQAVPRVAQQGPAVAAGNDLQAAVASAGVVQIEQDRQRVPVGQRIVGQVLVPLHHRAHVGGLHVDLAVLDQQVGSQKLLHAVQQPVRMRKAPEFRKVVAGLVDPSYAVPLGGLGRFHFHLGAVVLRQGVPGADPLDFFAESVDLSFRQEPLADDKTVGVVLADLLWTQHVFLRFQ